MYYLEFFLEFYISFFKMRGRWSQMLGGELFEESDSDQDAIKQALIETSPVLLGITIAVSILHTILEFVL